jgi:hypothetical protein
MYYLCIKERTKTNSIMRELILSDLVNNAGDYQLEGVEFTQEDVDYVERLIADGKSYDEAIGICLSEIYDVLNCDEEEDFFDDEEEDLF